MLLPEAVMRRSGAPNTIAALELAPLHEIERADEAIPLIVRVGAIRAAALMKADRPPAPPLSKDGRDALWMR